MEYEKLLNKNYGSIPHLSNSKLNMEADKRISIGEEDMLTRKTRHKYDIIIVTEKVDGANVGIFKKNGNIFGVSRTGLDVRDSTIKQIRLFQDYIDKHKNRYSEMLKEGERVCGEWMIKTHSLEYDMPHEPFIAFDYMDSNNNRLIYDELKERCEKFEVITTGLVHKGTAISVKDAMNILGTGFHGCVEQPEGIVYKYERKDKVIFMAKYVREHKIDGVYMNDETRYNTYTCL